MSDDRAATARGAGRRASGPVVGLAVLAALAACSHAEPAAGAQPSAVPSAAAASAPAAPPVTTSTTQSPPPPTTAPPPPPPTCAVPVSTWPLDRVAGLVITAPAQLTRLSSATAMVRSGVGGVILYGGPAPADVAAQLHALHVAAGSWRLVVATDEEGGDIQRLRGVTGGLAWARQQAAQGPAAVQAGALRVGRQLAAVGVDVDLAPVADLDAGPGPDAQHPDGQRSFSASPSVAGADVVAFAQGLQQAGVLAVVKHFPGLGTASGNTDVSTASTAPFGTFAGRDLLPFGAAVAAGAGGVMMANAVVPGLSTQPVVLSSAATTTLLRGQLGFHGVVFTDSLSAGAIAQAGLSVPQAAVAALGAGADDVLFGTATTVDPAPMAGQIRAAIVSAVRAGTLPEARVRDAATRIARSLGSPVC